MSRFPLRSHLVLSLICVLFLTATANGGGKNLTKVTYDKIKGDSSQTLADIEKIMGGKGTELKPAELKDVVGVEVKGLKGVQFVRWGNERQYIVVMIGENKVLFKAAKGLILNTDPTRVTKNNFDKMANDLSLAEVEQIMGGKGIEIPKDDLKKTFGAETPPGVTVVRWGDDDRYIAGIFLEGKLKAKRSKNLDEQPEK